MANFEGHVAKRQKTDYEGGRENGGADGTYYGDNYNKGGGRRDGYEEKPNHVILITVQNPAYPITTDVIHKICSPSGKVLRIVVFKKNGVQSMVEFESVEAAAQAKEALHGCDIYSGCCTLKIEFAKPTKLNVYKNDNESWDYTNESLVKQGSDRPALLQEPPRGYGLPDGYDGGRSAAAPGYEEYDGYMPPRGPRDSYGPPVRDPYGPPDRYGRGGYGRDGPPGPHGGPGYGSGGAMLPPPPGGPPQGTVIMIYGLSKEMNADRVFNVLCLYGNVAKVKFLKSKDGCAMVQMGDPIAVERAVGHLNGAVLFESKLQVGYSKQVFLNDVNQPFQLPDGSPSFKEFLKNRNNRFSTPEAALKNRILPPSKLLHFFNAPFGITEDEMKKVFEDQDAPPPTIVKIFPAKKQSERSSSGLLEFDEVSQALEALALCNHVLIPNPSGKFPYVLKLCFSSAGGSRNRDRGGDDY